MTKFFNILMIDDLRTIEDVPELFEAAEKHIFSYTLEALENNRPALYDFIGQNTAVSSQDAIAWVENNGVPEIMSFDHDLGGDDTTTKFMWWLINAHLDGKLDLVNTNCHKIFVHSANQVGAEKLIALWEGFARHSGSPIKIVRVWPTGGGKND